jgi:hypothetical protein
MMKNLRYLIAIEKIKNNVFPLCSNLNYTLQITINHVLADNVIIIQRYYKRYLKIKHNSIYKYVMI